MAVGRFHGKELGPFCWPVPTAGLAVFSASIALLSILLKFNAFAGIQKALVDQTCSRAPNSSHDIFWWKFGFGKHFGASSRCSLLAGCCQLYKIHFLSHITIQLRDDSLLLYRIREDDTSKWFYFIFFSVSSQGTHLLSFFTFPICFKCQMTVEWSTLSSSATSHIVVRQSGSTMALNWLLSAHDGWPLPFSSSRLLSSLQNFLNHHWALHSLATPEPNLSLMLWVVSAALGSILSSN